MRTILYIAIERSCSLQQQQRDIMAGLLLYLLLIGLLLHSSSADTLVHSCGGGNYTTNSTYQSNLNHLLAFFASQNSTFSNHTQGSYPDTVYGLFLCRGDVGLSDCSTCVQNAVQDVFSLCPSSKQATLWYDNCELRYSNALFFGTVDSSDSWIMFNLKSFASPADNFIQLESDLLDKLIDRAADNSSLLFATGAAVNGSDMKLNGLAQCTRDLSMGSCRQCLGDIHTEYTGTSYVGRVGGRVLGKNCNFRYEVYPFYKGNPTVLLNLAAPPRPSPSPFATSPPTPSTSTEGSKDDTKKVLIIVIPIVVVVLLLISVCVFFWRKRATKHTSGIGQQEEISNVDSLLLDLSTLKVATDNFSESNKLGEGGFGSVYKGKLQDGQEIAVKKLSTSSSQGVEELKNEFALVAKLQHRNLVKLLGVCLEEQEKLLVYEYVPNGSLDNLLFDPIKCKQLDWEQRFNITGGIARGLFYLHEESHLKVIHRDLKASNILLDTEMNPKISDFGLARLFGGDETHGITSRVVGTFGYMAPEYAMHGHLSTKVDVFSYGVLLLEIVTGRKSNSLYDSKRAEDFLSYVWEHWSKGTILEILDPSLENCSKNEVLRSIHIALLCVQEVPSERPPMSLVVVMLHSPSVPLQAPQQPRFSYGMAYSNMLPKQTDTSVPMSINDVSITEMQPR